MMRPTVRYAAIHVALWSADPAYRIAWHVGLWSMALLVLGFICISKQVAGPSPGSWARPLNPPSGAPAKPAPATVPNNFFVERTACLTNGFEAVKNCTILIDGHKVSGKQLAAIYTQRGFLQRETQPDNALSDYNMALKIEPDFIDALNGRAWIYMTREQYDEAVQDLTRALDQSPPKETAAIARYYRGYAELKLKNYASAISDLDEAIKLQPGKADYYLARGQARQGLSIFDAALLDFDEFTTRAPKDDRGLVLRGAVLEAMGKPLEALIALERAVERSPNDDYAISERDRLRGKQEQQQNKDEPAK